MSEPAKSYTSSRGVRYTTAAYGAQVDARIPDTVGKAKITVHPGNTWKVSAGVARLDQYGFDGGDFPTLRDAMEYTDRALSDAVGRYEAERILAEQAKTDRAAWLAKQWDDATDYLTNG